MSWASNELAQRLKIIQSVHTGRSGDIDTQTHIFNVYLLSDSEVSLFNLKSEKKTFKRSISRAKRFYSKIKFLYIFCL